jgi:phosphatidylglycerophosphate synthase
VALLAGALGVAPELLPAPLLAGAGLLALGLDGLDGWVARRTGRASAFGATLDMELDAVTVLLLSALAWWLGRAGPWVLVAGLLRYAYAVAAALHPAFTIPLGPRPLRRVAAGLAVGGLSLALALPGAPGLGLCAAVVALLVHSFGTDALWQWRRR